ncbi:hypothetical protein Rcae01_02023 [Novipirellula caenicola]|uniref:PH domain-containing protein n=1 Tax=Novipirellula caenicola TaxID=1536901 RepID=A0ABP9VQI3_9BACT
MASWLNAIRIAIDPHFTIDGRHILDVPAIFFACATIRGVYGKRVNAVQ